MVTFLEQYRDVFTTLLSYRIPPALGHVLITVITLAALALAYRFVYNDYHAFLALGRGATPSTFRGYLLIIWLRYYALKAKDCLIPPPLTPNLLPSSGYLLRLPPRDGPRPNVDGIAPHRQLNQKPHRRVHEAMELALRDLADMYPSTLRIGTSAFEKYGFALFLNTTAAVQQKGTAHLNETCRDTGEICHLHDTETSLHLTLQPHDAALVISQGWGERHPIAGQVIWGEVINPPGFMMVYAPQTMADVRIVTDIVRAAAWWVGGLALGEGGERGTGVLARGGEEGLF